MKIIYVVYFFWYSLCSLLLGVLVDRCFYGQVRTSGYTGKLMSHPAFDVCSLHLQVTMVHVPT